MASRSTWTGAIEFGGFPIHLKAYNLVRSRNADSFKTVCPCHQVPVIAPRMCAVDEVLVETADCSKAVEQGGKLQILPDAAVEAMKDVDATKMLPILSLPPLTSVPLHLALAHYRLIPDDSVAGSAGPANILWNGLLGAERCLVTEWVIRSGSRNQLLALHADVHGLNGTTLPYKSDFNAVPEHRFEADEQATAMFEAFSAQQGLDMDEFAHGSHIDAYAERRAEAIAAALEGKPIPTSASAPQAESVPDLMAAMKASLAAAGSKPVNKKAPVKRARAPKKAGTRG